MEGKEASYALCDISCPLLMYSELKLRNKGQTEMHVSRENKEWTGEK